MSTNFVPSREAELVAFTNNFAAKLTTSATLVGCTSAQAMAFITLNGDWVNSYAVANAPSTRTRDTIQTKNNAKKLCVANLRQLAGIIQKFPGTSNTLRAQFGLTIPAPRTPIPVPTVIPTIDILKRYGTTVIIRLHDGTSTKTFPAGVQGARVYTFTGAAAPTDPDAWKLEGQTTRGDVEVQFPLGTAPGTTVWFTAAFYNPRGQLGPGCAAVSTVLAGGSMSLAA